MKCPNCGKKIANDSQFCEFCGTKINVVKPSKSNWRLWTLLCVVGSAIIVLPGVLFLQFHKSSIDNDLKEMNLHGPVSLITEITYYSDPETGVEKMDEYGGFFDNATFLACVYGDEHIARFFYKKWFLSQVSDCEIQFNLDGNITSIRSIHTDENRNVQGLVRYMYDEGKKVVEMDTRVEAGNQNEGIVTYTYAREYNVSGQLVQMEYLTQIERYGTRQYTIEYITNSADKLEEAIFTSNRHEGHFKYSDNRLKSICFKNYWGEGIDASFKIDYNRKGDVQSISTTGTKGRSESARITTFEYQYDSYGNWVERKGTIKFISGEIYNIRTSRMYQYN